MSEIIVKEEAIKRHRYAIECWHCYRVVGFDDNDISCRGVHTEGKYMTAMNEHVVCPYCRARIWTEVDETYERFKKHADQVKDDKC